MIMRIAFFSDVHGNIAGLREVIKEIEKYENIAHIVGLGDYFGWDDSCYEIIDLLTKKNVILIRGNHDEELNMLDNGEDNGFCKDIYVAHEWLLKNLTKDDYKKYITTLPTVFRLKLNDKYSLIGFHAASEDMFSNTCGTDNSYDTLEKTYGKLQENVIIYGHFHKSHIIPLKDKLLINCASVGIRRDDNLSSYTIIEYDEEKIAVIQKQIPYDRNKEKRFWELVE